MESLRLSVCVCAHEGADRVRDTLWSLVRQSASPDRYEVVVVDNAPRDPEAMRAVVAEFDDQPVALTLVVEPEGIRIKQPCHDGTPPELPPREDLASLDAGDAPEVLEEELPAVAPDEVEILKEVLEDALEPSGGARRGRPGSLQARGEAGELILILQQRASGWTNTVGSPDGDPIWHAGS